MSRGRWDWSAWAAAIFLAVLHLAALGAEWIAPHDPTVQSRSLVFSPPTPPRLVDASGWHWRPFIHPQAEDPERYGEYVEDRTVRYPLRFGVERADPWTGEPRRYLIGVEEPGFFAPLGTDRYGRDLLSRWLHGARYSLLIGLLASTLTVGLGLILGAIAGFYGGLADHGIMRLVDLLLALPWLYLLLAGRALLPLDLDARQVVWLLIGVLTFLGWAVPARLVRGVTLTVTSGDALLAARGFGASDAYLLRHHVLPQVWPVARTQWILRIPRFVLAEVTLSFFGIGISEPVPSWGTLLAELQNFSVVTEYWWMSFPAVVLILVVLSYHRLANVL